MKLFNKSNEQKTKRHGSVYYRPPDRTRKDLGKYRDAITIAERPYNPNRKQLYNIYIEQLDYDAHLRGILEKRTMNINNKDIQYVVNGEVDEKWTEFFTNPRFADFLKDIQETKYWGFSLFEFDYTNGFDYYLVPRKNVNPVSQEVLREEHDLSGLQFDEDNFTAWAGGKRDLGILKTAVYYSIVKRNMLGDWANYSELAGNNFTVIEYEGNDKTAAIAVRNALKEGGSTGAIEKPDGVEMDFVNRSSTSQNELFEGLHQTLNEEQSKLILGQTMTTDDGSSRSQSEVHNIQQENIFRSDDKYVLDFLNQNFVKKINNYGAPDGYFKFAEVHDIDKMLDRDIKLQQLGYIFSTNYLREKYGIDD